jgi:(1->4)-alpha-D-glucan 1-alpha-D-glucosylmutase
LHAKKVAGKLQQTHYKYILMIIPSCTYRIQFNPRFTFNHLAEIIDYLEELGVTAIYASPILQPTRGSEHGYDGIDTTRLNPELGTIENLKELCEELKSRGIGWIQDIVPNHLAFNTTNVWLRDVLERGMNSSYSDYFDIDWEHPEIPHKLMAPFLETSLEATIDQGKLGLFYEPDKGFYFSFYNQQYPLCFESYTQLLSLCFRDKQEEIKLSLDSLISQIKTEYDNWQQLKKNFLYELSKSPFNEIQDGIMNLSKDRPALLQLFASQHYVLCAHTESHKYINYRRFFNVNGLICLCIEKEKVFDDYHRYIHQLYEQGIIQGLRIDHVDGLRNPHEYIRRLRKLFGDDCYIIVEKILDVKEELPASMAIHGTSGYEFLSYINQVITDRKGSEKLLAVYNEYVPENKNYQDIVFNNKLANFDTYLHGEWDNLIRYLLSLNLVENEEIKIPPLKLALGVFMAAFPVYRVYIEQLPLEINDERLVVEAFVFAFKRYPELKCELTFLRSLFEPHPDEDKNSRRLLFIQRLMQFTGPLAAKGIEDTTFYQYNPLISHNEVGDQPCVLGIPVREFHEKMQDRQQRNSLSMNCTSTHDTKRGEDNRIRINIISEFAEEWSGLVAEWQKLNEPYRKRVNELLAPIVNDEYFLYQAIIGGFPEDLVVNEEFIQRTKTYFVKVLRESKFMSDHVKPNIAYEEACIAFIDHLFNPGHSFLPTLIPFVKKVIRYSNIYTMVQVIIKTTAPGIPDIYQGCELWDLSYVDPDNRRPVNFELRRHLLEQLKQKEQEKIDHLLEWASNNYEIGTQKLLVTRKILSLRKQHNRLFIEGDYIPVYSEGSDRVVIAYFRRLWEQWLLIVLPLGLVANTGKELRIKIPDEAPQKWRNLFTREKVNSDSLDVRLLFNKFPVAVLEPC